MEKKKKNPLVSSLNFFGGIFLCLFSVSLIMNVWYIARVFTFLPSYFFGAGSYVIYGVIYLYGMSFLFREKPLKKRKPLTIIGYLIMFVALIIGLTCGFNKEALNADAIGSYNNAFMNFPNYLKYAPEKSLGLFDTKGFNFSSILADGTMPEGLRVPFGGGYLGHAIVTFFDSTGRWLTWTLVSILFLVGLFLVLRKYIIGFVKKSIPSSKKRVKEENGEKRDIYMSSSSLEEMEWENYQNRPMNNGANAPTMEEAPVEKRVPIITNAPITPVPGYGDVGVFKPARYYSANMPAPTVAEAPAPDTRIEAMPPVEEKHEQQYLDFDAPTEVDQTLVTAKPEFEDYKVKENPAPSMEMAAPAPSVAPIPQPMISQPVAPQMEAPAQIKKPLKWVPPSSDMLLTVEISEALDRNTRVAEERRVALDQAFQDYNIDAHIENYTIGPSVTRFNIKFGASASSKTVERYVEDISRRLGGVNTRFESIVEGQYTSGLEVPNATITTVSFKEVYEALPDVKKHPLAVAFGKNIQGDVICADLNEFPHGLVAGTTGSGKSVYVNSVITTLIMRNSPDDLRIVLVDPKKVEMSKYKDMPHLLCPVVNDAHQAKLIMDKLVQEMEERYALFEKAEGCTSIKEYNEYALDNSLPKMPYVVVFLDEYADLVDTCKEISLPVVSIAQKARACGIHMMISTQRPSTNVITGTIKGNLPTHIALMTASTVDSVTIVGEGGAEKLLGKGDMLVQSPLVSRVGMVRLQSCFIQRKEMNYVVGYLKEHYPLNYDEKFLNLEEASAASGQAMVASGEVDASMDPAEEEKYKGVKEWVMSQQYMSMSRIQRECAVGFNRAGRFFIRLQNEGVVAKETDGNKGCRVLRSEDTSSSIPVSDEVSSIG